MWGAMPSHEELQAVIGRAVVDPAFCRDLLNGHRRERLAEFRLSSAEREMATAVQARDLAGFAQAVDRWICSQPAVPRTASRESPGESRHWWL